MSRDGYSGWLRAADSYWDRVESNVKQDCASDFIKCNNQTLVTDDFNVTDRLIQLKSIDPNYATLKENLSNWTDIDGTEYKLGVILGLWSGLFSDIKYIFWTNNQVETMLFDILKKLADSGILEYNQEKMQFRWNVDSPAKLVL